MANVPFKTIKFPGLSDTYTVPEIDSTLAVTGAAADAKKTGDEITNVKQALTTKAPLTGLSADLVAGSAEQLLSDVMTEDNAPYLFRANPTGSDREYDEIVGGTVAWNQLLAQDASKWGTRYTQIATSTGNVLTFTVSEQNNAVKGIYVSIVPNHKYLFVGTITPSEGYSVLYGAYTSLAENQYTYRAIVAANEGATAVANIFDAGAASTFALVRPTATPNGDVATTKDIQLIDLTAMFGSTIADYVYSLETATAGSGIAWLKSYDFFTADYYPYSAPTLKSIEGLSGHVTRGFNQWDEEWEVGAYNNDGTKDTTSDRIRSKNFIPVLPGETYFVNIGMYTLEYDADKNFITRQERTQAYRSWTVSNKTRYITFNTYSNYGTTYKHDICINLSKTSGTPKNGDYVPYDGHTYALDSTKTLRGILKLDASNHLYADGDVYGSDGTVTRNYAEVDLGSLTWSYMSDDGYFRTAEISGAISPVLNGTPNIRCAKYDVYTGGLADFKASDKKIFAFATNVSSVPRIAVRDTGYTDAATFKAALDGVKLVYPIVQTTESADPFVSPQIIDPDGTEEYVYASGGSGLPVGHNSKYPANLRDEVERVMVAVPSAPSENGTYSLKCTVSSGTPSYEWASE